jgi:hypothetical protein
MPSTDADAYGVPGRISRLTEAEMMAKYPEYPWRSPLLIHVPEGSGLACRICVGQRGIVGLHVRMLPQSVEGHEQHLREVHPNV